MSLSDMVAWDNEDRPEQVAADLRGSPQPCVVIGGREGELFAITCGPRDPARPAVLVEPTFRPYGDPT
jgi:hypothetical protein